MWFSKSFVGDRFKSRWDQAGKKFGTAEARTKAIAGLPELSDGMTGASPTGDPAGAEADLQKQLQNEQRQRARSNAIKNLYGFGG